MITKKILKAIQSIKEYPSLSIVMPTHRTFPDNRQDQIRLKNLAASAKKRLLSEFGEDEIKSLLKNLDEIMKEIDFNYVLNGIAIFVNSKNRFKFNLQFPVPERVSVDSTFATRDLTYGYNRSQLYLVVILSEKTVRLLSGSRESIYEVNNADFPCRNKEFEDTTDTSFNDRLRENPERLKKFFRLSLTKIKDFCENEDYPVILLGVERNISFFRGISNGLNVISEISGNYDYTGVNEVMDLSWNKIKKYYADKRETILKAFRESFGFKKGVSGIDEVWKIAQQGRIKTLLTELNFHYPAKTDETGYSLISVEEKKGANVMDDAVDEIIEKVLASGGNALFYESGSLSEYDKIGAILKY